jgi:hypothetical protein
LETLSAAEIRDKFRCLGSNIPFSQRFTVVGETWIILDRRYTPILRFSIADASRTEKSSKKKKKKMHHIPLYPEGSALIRLRAMCSTITMISDQDFEQAQAALRDMAKMLFDHLNAAVSDATW